MSAEWADRVWENNLAIRLDADARYLANLLLDKVMDSPDQAAHIIAALVQTLNTD